MLAITTGKSYDPAMQTTGPDKVALTFRHLLSRIDLVCRQDNTLGADNFQPRIYAANLHGMYSTADFSSGGYDPSDNGTILGCWTQTGEQTTAAAPYYSRQEETGIPVPAGEELTLLTDAMVIISPDGFIVFGTPEVDPWKNAVGGITIVD